MTTLFILITTTIAMAQIPSPDMDLTNPDQIEINSLIPVIEERIRRPMPVPVIIKTSMRRLSDSLELERDTGETIYDAWANPVYIDVNGRWERDLSATMSSACLIQIGASGELARGVVRTSLLAHELFHCFQFSLIGWGRLAAHPRWLVEGSAAFAGEYFANGSLLATSWWNGFLNYVVDLRSVIYPGIGIFALLNQSAETDIFEKIDRLLTSSPENLWTTLGSIATNGEKVNFASPLQRKPEWGYDYEIQFPEVPRGSNFPNLYAGVIELPSGFEIAPGRIKHIRYFIPRNEIIEIIPEGQTYGRIRIMQGDETAIVEREIIPGQSLKLCRGENCGCQSGDEAYDVIHIVDDAPSIQFYVSTFDENINHIKFRRGEPRCCTGSRNLDPRFVGTWSVEMPILTRAAKPPQATNPISTFDGEHEVTIQRNGVVTRSGVLAIDHQWQDHRGNVLEFYQKARSYATACLESKEANPGMGMFKQHGLVESSHYDLISRRNGRTMSHQSKSEEWPMIRWGTGMTGETGSYQFLSDTELRIRGEPRTYRKLR